MKYAASSCTRVEALLHCLGCFWMCRRLRQWRLPLQRLGVAPEVLQQLEITWGTTLSPQSHAAVAGNSIAASEGAAALGMSMPAWKVLKLMWLQQQSLSRRPAAKPLILKSCRRTCAVIEQLSTSTDYLSPPFLGLITRPEQDP